MFKYKVSKAKKVANWKVSISGKYSLYNFFSHHTINITVVPK